AAPRRSRATAQRHSRTGVSRVDGGGPRSLEPEREHHEELTRMNPCHFHQTRRSFLGGTALGLGSVVLSWLMGPRSASAAEGKGAGVKGLPHFAPKAKRVIFLYMSGGPSHLE